MELFASVHFTPMFAASIEGIFVFLIIAAVSAIFNAMKKKNGSEDDWSSRETAPPNLPRPRETSKPYGRPEVTPKKVDWEEELIRILQGAGAQVPPPRKVPPSIPPPVRKAPPVVPKAQPKSQPTMAVPEIFRGEKLYKGHCDNCGGYLEFLPKDMDAVISCPHCHRPTSLRPFIQTPVETLTQRKEVGSFGQGAKTWQQASPIPAADTVLYPTAPGA